MESKITSGHLPTHAPERPPKGLRQKLERMLAGAQAMPDGSSIPIAGGAVPKAEMVRRLAEGVAYFDDIDAQLLALRLARGKLLSAATDLQELHTVWKASLAVSLGRKNPQLTQFGLKPQAARRALTSEERVVRAAKARQTRRLRHTGGVRQKAALRYQGKVVVRTELRPTPGPVIVASPPRDSKITPAGTETKPSPSG
jgi:hypothetical protein